MWSFKPEQKQLSIQLLEPVIFVGSNLQTSPVVRGTVHITPQKSILVESVSIQFTGSMKTQYKQGKLDHHLSII